MDRPDAAWGGAREPEVSGEVSNEDRDGSAPRRPSMPGHRREAGPACWSASSLRLVVAQSDRRRRQSPCRSASGSSPRSSSPSRMVAALCGLAFLVRSGHQDGLAGGARVRGGLSSPTACPGSSPPVIVGGDPVRHHRRWAPWSIPPSPGPTTCAAAYARGGAAGRTRPRRRCLADTCGGKDRGLGARCGRAECWQRPAGFV